LLFNRIQNLLVISTLLISLVSCSMKQTFTPQPKFTVAPHPTETTTPIAFEHYGQTLTNVAYCTVDAAQKMDLYFPASGGPWRTLVYVHGGSWMHGDKSEASMFAHMMTSLGYLVVSLNYRLYPPATWPSMIQDVKCAIRSLRAHAGEYNLDANRIAAIGPSAGGHLVSLLGTTDQSAGYDVGEYLDQSSRVQAVIAMAAVTDLTQNFPNADIELMKRIGFGEDNIVEASPITYVTPDDPPFLLIHGDQDELVPYQQSQLLYDKLVQANVPAQLVIVKNARHSLIDVNADVSPSLLELNQMILQFLEKYLQ
jgi:acetyl esterase/lipase